MRNLIYVDYLLDSENDGLVCSCCGHDHVNFVMEPAFDTVLSVETVYVCTNCMSDRVIDEYGSEVSDCVPCSSMVTGSLLGGLYV